MIIAKGNVSTAEGPVPAENLKPGMLVVDRGHRARKLLKVERVQLHQTLHFERNADLVLAGNSILFTLTGLRSAISLPAGGIHQAGLCRPDPALWKYHHPRYRYRNYGGRPAGYCGADVQRAEGEFDH